jgi:hypothetical protein
VEVLIQTSISKPYATLCELTVEIIFSVRILAAHRLRDTAVSGRRTRNFNYLFVLKNVNVPVYKLTIKSVLRYDQKLTASRLVFSLGITISTFAEKRYRVTLFWWLLRMPPDLTSENSTLCPHNINMCFIWIQEHHFSIHN